MKNQQTIILIIGILVLVLCFVFSNVDVEVIHTGIPKCEGKVRYYFEPNYLPIAFCANELNGDVVATIGSSNSEEYNSAISKEMRRVLNG